MAKALEAILSLSEPSELDPVAVVNQANKYLPNGSEFRALLPVGASIATMIGYGTVTISVRMFTTPVPAELTGGAVSLDRRPEVAADLFESDQAHVYLSVVSSIEDHKAALEAAKALSILAAVTAQVLDSTHGIWLPARKVWVAEDLGRASQIELQGENPDFLWVNPQFFKGSASTARALHVGGYTFGLEPFVGREIEMEPVSGDPQEIMLRMTGLIAWILQDGMFMKDGDTIGDRKEAIRLTFQDQGRRVNAPIIRMEINGVVGVEGE